MPPATNSAESTSLMPSLPAGNPAAPIPIAAVWVNVVTRREVRVAVQIWVGRIIITVVLGELSRGAGMMEYGVWMMQWKCARIKSWEWWDVRWHGARCIDGTDCSLFDVHWSGLRKDVVKNSDKSIVLLNQCFYFFLCIVINEIITCYLHAFASKWCQ